METREVLHTKRPLTITGATPTAHTALVQADQGDRVQRVIRNGLRRCMRSLLACGRARSLRARRC
jgi:hypothetical protein